MNLIQEQFEAWATRHRLPLHKDGVVVTYAARATDDAWQAWIASREAIEVKLPDDGIEDCEAQWGERCRNTFDCGYNFASVQHEKAIVAAGIKVEG